MEKVFEVRLDGGSETNWVTGYAMFVEEGFLHIQDENGLNVAIYAQFDSVIIKPKAKEE